MLPSPEAPLADERLDFLPSKIRSLAGFPRLAWRRLVKQSMLRADAHPPIRCLRRAMRRESRVPSPDRSRPWCPSCSIESNGTANPKRGHTPPPRFRSLWATDATPNRGDLDDVTATLVAHDQIVALCPRHAHRIHGHAYRSISTRNCRSAVAVPDPEMDWNATVRARSSVSTGRNVRPPTIAERSGSMQTPAPSATAC